MRTTVGAATTLVAWCVLGCATTYRGVGSVVADVRRDEVAAAVAMKDDYLGLRGRIASKGLVSEKVAEAKPMPWGWAPTKVELKDKNVGVVNLESTTAEPGRARCLFESWALEKLATVREGQTVNLVCQFYEVVGEPGDRIPVFRNCHVDD